MQRRPVTHRECLIDPCICVCGCCLWNAVFKESDKSVLLKAQQIQTPSLKRRRWEGRGVLSEMLVVFEGSRRQTCWDVENKHWDKQKTEDGIREMKRGRWEIYKHRQHWYWFSPQVLNLRELWEILEAVVSQTLHIGFRGDRSFLSPTAARSCRGLSAVGYVRLAHVLVSWGELFWDIDMNIFGIIVLKCATIKSEYSTAWLIRLISRGMLSEIFLSCHLLERFAARPVCLDMAAEAPVDPILLEREKWRW